MGGSKKRRDIIIAICALVMIGAFVIPATELHEVNSAGNIPEDIIKTTKFQLYYPKSLPSGMFIDKNSFSKTEQVVTFNFDYDKNKKLIVSEQPLSDKGVIDTFNPTKKTTTAIGTGYIVDMEDRVTAAVVADGSWIVINAPNKIDMDIMEEFIKSLQPVKP